MREGEKVMAHVKIQFVSILSLPRALYKVWVVQDSGAWKLVKLGDGTI